MILVTLRSKATEKNQDSVNRVNQAFVISFHPFYFIKLRGKLKLNFSVKMHVNFCLFPRIHKNEFTEASFHLNHYIQRQICLYVYLFICLVILCYYLSNKFLIFTISLFFECKIINLISLFSLQDSMTIIMLMHTLKFVNLVPPAYPNMYLREEKIQHCVL